MSLNLLIKLTENNEVTTTNDADMGRENSVATSIMMLAVRIEIIA